MILKVKKILCINININVKFPKNIWNDLLKNASKILKVDEVPQKKFKKTTQKMFNGKDYLKLVRVMIKTLNLIKENINREIL